MTAQELIGAYDAERPNQIDTGVKLSWIQKVEWMILRETVLTHSNDPRFTPRTKPGEEKSAPFDPERYFDTWDLESELLAPPPYEDVYTYYLDMRQALNAGETKRYNQMMSLYNNAMLTFQQYYNRTYRPVKKSKRFLRHECL
ncbi:hypothetical protein ACTQW9_07655 [Lachnospiraceae bacterium LCP19S3_B12]